MVIKTVSFSEKEDNHLNKPMCSLLKLKEITTKCPLTELFEYWRNRRLLLPQRRWWLWSYISKLELSKTGIIVPILHIWELRTKWFLRSLKVTVHFCHSSSCDCCVSGCGHFSLYLLSIQACHLLLYCEGHWYSSDMIVSEQHDRSTHTNLVRFSFLHHKQWTMMLTFTVRIVA